MASHEEREFLAEYNPGTYPAVAYTTDVVLLTMYSGRFSVLLVQRDEHPFKGQWALPGGFVRPNETADAAAARVLATKTGLTSFPGALQQLRTYSDPGRDPRMRVVSSAYIGIAPNLPEPQAGRNEQRAQYQAVMDIEEDGGFPGLAFDHSQILADAVKRVRDQIGYNSLAMSFIQHPFTIPALRRVYEAVWDIQLNRPDFRRKILNSPGFVRATGNVTADPQPAELFVPGDVSTLSSPFAR